MKWLLFFFVVCTLREASAKNLGVNAIAMAPNGQFLASAALGKNLSVWSICAGKARLFKTLPLKSRSSGAPMAFSSDSQLLAVYFDSVQLWNWRAARPIRSFNHYGARVHRFAFSPDGDRLAGATSGGGVLLWNTRSGQLVKSLQVTDKSVFKRPDDSAIHALKFAPNGQLISGHGSGNIVFWNVRSGKESRRFVVQNRQRWLTISRDCRIAVGTTGNPTRVWSLRKARPVRAFALPSNFEHTDAVLSPDGQSLVVLSYARNANTVTVWNVQTGKLMRKWMFHAAKFATQIEVSVDGKLVVVGDTNGAIQLHRI